MKDIDVLIVEDDPDDAELTLHALNLDKYKKSYKHAKDGVEALELIFGKNNASGELTISNLKLIILDLKLPKLNGLEVLKALREDPRTKALPVVMLTSSKEKRDIIQAYNLGVNSYIVKPLSFDNYMEIVGTVGNYWTNFNQATV